MDPESVQFSTMMPAAMVAHIDRLAEAIDVSRARIVREAVAIGLDQIETDDGAVTLRTVAA